MYRIASASLLALTCIAGTAAAQQNARRAYDAARPHPILRMDVDNDGQITLDAALASPMARADADGDGFVTRDEFIAATVERATTRARAMFDRIDAGNEGRLALDRLPQHAQHEARMRRAFARADTDGDGVLSAAEIAEMPPRGIGKWHGMGKQGMSKPREMGRARGADGVGPSGHRRPGLGG